MPPSSPPALDERQREDLLFTFSRLHYVRSLRGMAPPFTWQADVLGSTTARKWINGARQAGKSTVVAIPPAHAARFWPGRDSVVIAATETQAEDDIRKIKEVIAADPHYPRLVGNAKDWIELDNGSVIHIRPATEKGSRGVSRPRVIVLEEVSRIEDLVIRSGVLPMLTDNPDCELLQLSTPNGRTGYFYQCRSRGPWERFEIRAPWDVDDVDWKLNPAEPEEVYRARRAKHGIRAYYSPRHANLQEQMELLEYLGPHLYRQEELCEFVEDSDQVFSYDDIEALVTAAVKPMKHGVVVTDEVQPIEVVPR